MLKLFVQKVPRTFNFTSVTRAYMRFSSTNMTNSSTVHHDPESSDQVSLKLPDHIGSIDEFLEVIEFPVLNPIKWNTGVYKPQFYKKPLSPFDGTLRASLDVRGIKYDSNPISFTSRRFFNFCNLIDKKKQLVKISYDRGKRSESSNSWKSDRINGNCGKKMNKTVKNHCRAFAEVDERPNEVEKPREVSRDSCKPETGTCGTVEKETISYIRDRGKRPRKTIVQPLLSSISFICDDSNDKAMKSSASSTLSPSSNKCYRKAESRKQMKNPSRCSNERSTGESTAHNPSKVLKTSADIEDEHCEKKNCFDKTSPTSCKSSFFTDKKNYESYISYADKMKDCSAPRFRRGSDHTLMQNCSDRVDDCCKSNDAERTKNTLFRPETPTETRKCCLETIKNESIRNFVLPKRKRSSNSISKNEPPNLTISGYCCFPKYPKCNSTSLANLSNKNPNLSSLKYRLSKCPSFSEMWRRRVKMLAVPPDPLPKSKRPVPRFPNRSSNCKIVVRKSKAYPDTGKWRKQRYNMRQRIYKCSQRESTSNRVIELNPCPPLIEDSEGYVQYSRSAESTLPVNLGQHGCIKRPEKPCNTKTYPMKMQESRQKATMKEIDRRKTCNRDCLSN